MRVERLFPVFALCACVNGLPYGLEPAPESEDDSYRPAIQAPDCRPNNDGTISREELPFVVGAVAHIRVKEGPVAVNVTGFLDENNTRRWDFSTPNPDSEPLARMQLQTMENHWFASSFPNAQYAGPLTPGGALLGPILIDESGVKILGTASAQENPPEGRTLAIYDAPITLYPFPLEENRRVTTSANATNAMLLGLPTAFHDDYDVEVTDKGTLVLPDLILENTLRVTIRLNRTLLAGDVRQVTHVWVHECLGEVARAISPSVPSAQSIPDEFDSADQVWRLSL